MHMQEQPGPGELPCPQYLSPAPATRQKPVLPWRRHVGNLRNRKKTLPSQILDFCATLPRSLDAKKLADTVLSHLLLAQIAPMRLASPSGTATEVHLAGLPNHSGTTGSIFPRTTCCY